MNDVDVGVWLQTLQAFQAALIPGMTLLRPIMLRLFGLLFFLEALKAAVSIAFFRAHAGAVLLRLGLRTAVVVSSFLLLPTLGDGLLRQATKLGLIGGGNVITEQQFLDPGAWGEIGFKAGKVLLTAMGEAGKLAVLTFGLFYLLAWLMLVGAHLYIGLSLFVLQIEYSLCLLGLEVLLPFATSRWTSWLSQGAIGLPVNLAMRFFLKALIASLCFTVLSKQADTANKLVVNVTNIQPALTLAILPALFAVLFWKCNHIAASLLNSQPALSAGSVLQAAAGGAILAGGAALAGGMAAWQLSAQGTRLAIQGATGLSTAYQMGAATATGGRLAHMGSGALGVMQAGRGLLTAGMQHMVQPSVQQLRTTMLAGRQAGFVYSGGTLPAGQRVYSTMGASGGPSPQQLRATMLTGSQMLRQNQPQGGGARPHP